MSSSGSGQVWRGLRRGISAWLPVVAGACVIAFESTTLFGSDHTTGPFRAVWEWLFGQVTDERWSILHPAIRKTGHFIGYGTLGLMWLRAWWMTRPRAPFVQNALLALLGTALIASGDEFHQSFLPNRTGTPWDVLLDCVGALVLMTMTWLFLRVSAPKRLERAA